MGFSRLIKFALAASMLLGFTALPCRAQSFPSYFPTQSNYQQTTVSTSFANDFIVNQATYGGGIGNFWAYGQVGLQAATSLNWASIAPISSLTQNTVFILPDPGTASATIALQGGSDSFSSIVCYVPISSIFFI